jgi:epimerase transport system membrane fusion protein
MQLQQALPSVPDAGLTLDVSDRLPRFIGAIILLIAFGGFGLWALFAPLDSAALAPGVVTVKSYRKTVQHLEGGIVSEILVTEGQLVERGQTLLVLDATQAKAELGILKGQYFTARARENRLAAERDSLESIELSEDLDVGDPRALEAVRNEQQIFAARRSDRLGEIEVLEQRIMQLESQIHGLQALTSSKTEIINSYNEEVADLSELLVDGYVDKQRLRELQRSRSRSIGEVADHRAAIAQAKVQIGETQLQILQLNKRFTTEVVDQLAQTQANVYDLRERISAIEDRVRRTIIAAPVGGIVLGMNTHTIGGVIRSGDTLLDIVPELAELVVDAHVSPIDIDRITLGMEATIRFSAFNNATTPIIHGTLTKISADRLVDEHTGNPYYLARMEVSEEGKENLGSLILVPGMPAEVLIKTGERTFFDYLIQPARNAFARSLIED